jgi:hypothetical protein
MPVPSGLVTAPPQLNIVVSGVAVPVHVRPVCGAVQLTLVSAVQAELALPAVVQQ